MTSFSSLFKLLILVSVTAAAPSKRATCTVKSVDDAKDIAGCSAVTLNAFTVPAGKTLVLNPDKGATVTMAGDITFAKTTLDGPLVTIDGTSINFVGADHKFDGNGALYWDGLGTNNGTHKPHPFLKIKGSGTYKKFEVLNSPAQAISVGPTDAHLTFDGITVDDFAGDTKNLGHNTDGFDVSANDVTIQNCIVKNQDDCIAINDGKNIRFENNQCSGGHGISIGSIATGKHVSNVVIKGNTVTRSMYGIRIKAQRKATSASVSGVTYDGNTISGIAKYGLLISQSYPDDVGTPGTGAPFSDVNFTGGATTIKVNTAAKRVTVECGNCSGNWDWSKLTVTGGKAGTIKSDKAKITGGQYLADQPAGNDIEEMPAQDPNDPEDPDTAMQEAEAEEAAAGDLTPSD
uniref:endo-polygalacturonase n=1 Tax=Chondrostereum purpureum TaxID=58369 RepID=Q9P8M4_9AGAR|nr:endopolygalacturonase [Chondrostereum purpureum]